MIKFLSQCNCDKNFLVNSLGIIMFWKYPSEIVPPGLPWWLSGQESTRQGRRHGFDPWPEKIPRAAEQLSPGAATIEPVPSLEPGSRNAWAHERQLPTPGRPRACVLQQDRPRRWEARAPPTRAAPLTTTREKQPQRWRPSTAQNKEKQRLQTLVTQNYMKLHDRNSLNREAISNKILGTLMAEQA